MSSEKPLSPYLSEIIHETNIDDLPKPELAGHMWRQEGNLLICQSCPFSHASYIEPGFQLYGINDKGMPMIRRIDVKH
jgi:hypothetical protein